MEERGKRPPGTEPTVSVIVPVHNGQDYLEGCIESIQDQIWTALEIIIAEDGSTDRTAQICMELEKKYRNITVLYMEDCGVSAGRNAGLLHARGEYVTFVDADDRLHPQMIGHLYRNLVETGSDVSGCGFFSWQTEAEWDAKKKEPAPEPDAGRLHVYGQKEFALKGILDHDTRCWSKLFRRECLRKARFREGLTIGEDMLFLVDLLPCINRAVSTDFAGYGYFVNPQGAMNRQFCPSYMDQIACWELAGEKLAGWAAEQKLDAGEAARMEETVAARQMTGIMLAAGKLAMLDARALLDNREYVDICHTKLRECLRRGKGSAYLEKGYRYKVRLFSRMPGLYLRLYGFGRRLKRRGGR